MSTVSISNAAEKYLDILSISSPPNFELVPWSPMLIIFHVIMFYLRVNILKKKTKKYG
jgi:hypothetical protein